MRVRVGNTMKDIHLWSYESNGDFSFNENYTFDMMYNRQSLHCEYDEEEDLFILSEEAFKYWDSIQNRMVPLANADQEYDIFWDNYDYSDDMEEALVQQEEFLKNYLRELEDMPYDGIIDKVDSGIRVIQLPPQTSKRYSASKKEFF